MVEKTWSGRMPLEAIQEQRKALRRVMERLARGHELSRQAYIRAHRPGFVPPKHEALDECTCDIARDYEQMRIIEKGVEGVENSLGPDGGVAAMRLAGLLFDTPEGGDGKKVH